MSILRLTVQSGLIFYFLSGHIAHAETCSVFFPSALQNHDKTGKIELKKDAQVLGDGDNLLQTTELKDASDLTSCGTSSCRASGSTSLPLSPIRFQSTSSSHKVKLTTSGTFILGSDRKNAYEDIDLTKDKSTLTDNGAYTEYFIKNLSVKKDSIINLRAGSVYWIEEFTIEDNSVINIIGEGTARLFIKGQFKPGKQVLINSPGVGQQGNAEKLFIYAFDDFKIDKDDITVSAIIYSEKEVEVKKGSTIYGAISAKKDIKLDDSTITYLPDAVSKVDAGSLCSGTSGQVDHFMLSHDGNGIHCTGEVINVTVFDKSGKVITGFTGTIVLDTQTGTGNWTGTTGSGLLADATTNDGLAKYTFSSSDNGKAGFVLNYPSGPATFNIDVYEGAIRDDDSEGDISFAPSGFILTKNVISNPPPAVINDPVADQIAATDFNVHITAYGTTETDAECGVIESYTGSKTINLIGSYINPANGTKSLSINSSGIAMTPPATSRPITFNNGQAVVVANYKDAGKIHFTIEDTTGPTLISGSTNDFVVKPASFIFQEISRVADNFSNPAAVDANGPVFIAAGQNFNIKVAAVNALNQVTTNYGNETPSESVALTHVLIAPAGGDAGTLIGNLSPQGNGIFTGIFNWSEVGIISMDANVADLDYLGAGNISGSSGNVGRFVPDHFVVADKLQGALDVNCTAGGFNYIGQSFGFVLGNHPEFKIQAKNLTGATTRNYTGSFAKLGLASVLISPVNQDSTNAMTITHQQSVASFLIAGNGVFNYTLGADLFTYDRSTTPVGLFDSDIDIIINSIADSDGVTDNFSAPEKLEPTAANIRYGRLMIESAFGSELVDLELPVRAEIYDSALGDYITHTDDTCSSFSVLPLEMLDSLDPSSLTSTLALPLAAGTTTLTISAPGEGNTGSVGVVLDAPSWLEFDWGRPLTETNRLEPKATASFGIYHGNDAFIYRREIR